MKAWLMGIGTWAWIVGGWCDMHVATSDENGILEIEIQALQKRRAHLEQLELNEEVRAQTRMMIADWEEYARDLEHIRHQEQEKRLIIERIQELEERKATFSNS